MKVLITGAEGYVGSSILRNVSDRYESVVGLNRSQLDLLDTRKVLEYFNKNRFDVIIHCAVVGGSRLKTDEWKVLDDNLTMYYNLLNCRSSYGKLLHFGSGAEIYAQHSPYGYSKSVIRRSVLTNEGFYNLRIFAVFDENELNSRFIKSSVNNYLGRKPMLLHQNRKMDFFYMQDLVSLVEYYIEQDNPQKEIDCTYHETKTFLEISDIVNRLSDHRVDVIVQSEEQTSYYGKHTKLPIEYVGLEEGIKRVYQKLIWKR